MTSKSLKFQYAILAAVLAASTSFAAASGPGIPIPMPPTAPQTVAFAGPGIPIPMPPTAPQTVAFAGPGIPIPMPPTAPQTVA